MEQKEQKLILGYWNIPGRGHTLRHLLEYTNLSYEEKKYDIMKRDEWFNQDKKTMDLHFPNLPYLLDGDYKLTESLTIANYIVYKAKKDDLLGNGLDKFRVDEIKHVLEEVQTNLFEILFKVTDKSQQQQLWEQKSYLKLEKIVIFLDKKEWLLGYITIADFFYYNVLSLIKAFLSDKYNLHKEIYDQYMTRFEMIPQIKAYRESPRYFI